MTELLLIFCLVGLFFAHRNARQASRKYDEELARLKEKSIYADLKIRYRDRKTHEP